MYYRINREIKTAASFRVARGQVIAATAEPSLVTACALGLTVPYLFKVTRVADLERGSLAFDYLESVGGEVESVAHIRMWEWGVWDVNYFNLFSVSMEEAARHISVITNRVNLFSAALSCAGLSEHDVVRPHSVRAGAIYHVSLKRGQLRTRNLRAWLSARTRYMSFGEHVDYGDPSFPTGHKPSWEAESVEVAEIRRHLIRKGALSRLATEDSNQSEGAVSTAR